MGRGIRPYFPNLVVQWSHPGNIKTYWLPLPGRCRGCGLGFRSFKNVPGDPTMQPKFGTTAVNSEALRTTMLKDKKV